MVRYQGVKDVTPGWVTGLGGAGGAIRGLIETQGELQRQELERERLDLARQADERGQGYLDLARRQMDLAFDRFDMERSQEEERRRSLEARQAALRSAMGARTSGAMLPPEFEQAMDLAIESGDVDSVEVIGQIAATSRIRKASDTLMEGILDDVRSGLWTTQGVTGMEVDYTGDGKPDPVEGIPAFFQQRLANIARTKEDPLAIAQEYQTVRRQIEGQMLYRQALQQNTAKWQAKYAPLLAATDDPARQAAAAVVLGEYGRGQTDREFGNSQIAARMAEQRYAQALLGNQEVVDQKTGAISYMNPQDALAKDEAERAEKMALLRERQQAMNESSTIRDQLTRARIAEIERNPQDAMSEVEESYSRLSRDISIEARLRAGPRPKPEVFDSEEEYQAAMKSWNAAMDRAEDDLWSSQPEALRKLRPKPQPQSTNGAAVETESGGLRWPDVRQALGEAAVRSFVPLYGLERAARGLFGSKSEADPMSKIPPDKLEEFKKLSPEAQKIVLERLK